MKRYAVWICAALSFCLPGLRADLGESGSEKVPYVRRLPATVRKWLPRQGKHRFFGESKLKYNGHPVSIHVYDAAKTNFSEHRTKYGAKDYAPKERQFQGGHLNVDMYGVQKIGLSFFVAEPKQKGRFKRISTTQFSYVRFVNTQYGTKETVGVKTLWLNPERETVPALVVDLHDPEGALGPIGVEMLVIFPNGLAEKAVATGFGYGADNSSSSNSWFSQFEDVDEKGFRTIKSTQASFGEETTTIYKWNGKFFTSVKHQTVKRDPFAVETEELP